MKTEIKKDGYIHITAETVTEALALKYILGEKEYTSVVDGKVVPVVFDFSIFFNRPPTTPLPPAAPLIL